MNGTDGELLRRTLHHPAFTSYSCRELDRATMVSIVAKKLQVKDSHVESLLLEAPSKCEVDQELLSILQATNVQLFGWVDIPPTEWQQIYSLFPQSLWQNFTGLSTDLDSLVQRSNNAAVIIDKSVEVASLHSFQGLQSLPYESSSSKKSCRTYLKRRFLLPRAVEKGMKHLKEAVASRDLMSAFIFENGQQELVREVFTPCLLMWCLPDMVPPAWPKSLQALVEKGQPFGFLGEDLSRYPGDTDTMAVCVSTLLDFHLITPDQAMNFFEICVRNTNDQNQVLTYLDAERPRIDPVVLANFLYLAYSLSMEDHPVVRYNESLVQRYLLSGCFVYGTRYYGAQDDFLYFYGRVLAKFGDRGSVADFDRVYQALKSALINRIGNKTESTPLDVAKRILLSRQLGIHNTADVDLLLEMQNEDGSWPFEMLCNLPSSKAGVFNSVVDLCFAVKALQISSFEASNIRL